jgi:hypothetical protein
MISVTNQWAITFGDNLGGNAENSSLFLDRDEFFLFIRDND